MGRKKWNRPPDIIYIFIYLFMCLFIYLFTYLFIYLLYIYLSIIYHIYHIWFCPTRMELIPNGITGCVSCRFLTKHIQNISISANGPNSLVMVSVLSGSYSILAESWGTSSGENSNSPIRPSWNHGIFCFDKV